MSFRYAVLLSVACLAMSPAVSASAQAVRAGDAFDGPSIPVRVSGHGKVQAPAQVHPRYEEIFNHSARELIVVAKGRFGARRLVEDLSHDDSPILSGRAARDFVVVDTVAPHGDVYTVLAKGTYLIAVRTSKNARAGDVATVRVSGSREDVPPPSAESEIEFTRTDRLAMPDPTYTESALYIVDDGSRTVQIRLYRLSEHATAAQIAAFTSHPTWARLDRLPITSAADIATLAAGRWVSDENFPTPGRYVAVAAPLRPGRDHRPRLTPALVAAVRIED